MAEMLETASILKVISGLKWRHREADHESSRRLAILWSSLTSWEEVGVFL